MRITSILAHLRGRLLLIAAILLLLATLVAAFLLFAGRAQGAPMAGGEPTSSVEYVAAATGKVALRIYAYNNAYVGSIVGHLHFEVGRGGYISVIDAQRDCRAVINEVDATLRVSGDGASRSLSNPTSICGVYIGWGGKPTQGDDLRTVVDF